MSNNDAWMQRDIASLWHPCTQMKDHETLPVTPIRRGRGVWLEDFDGRQYLDAISSWWVNIFGHANERINDRIRAQLDSLEHVILSGFTHQPVIELSERLGQLTPVGLGHCFYADNGSAAVEIALKMSYHYWYNVGRPEKRRFLTITNGYHGETLGALSVGDVAIFTETYRSLLLDVLKVPAPDGFGLPREQWVAEAREKFAHMEAALERHHHELAAVIVEPLIQCAGGMRMYPPEYLGWLREACDRYNVQLIFDEIAVGFGRTGTLFACEQASVRPDYLCLSKAITGGYLPLSVVMTTDEVYDAFYDDYASLRAFLHSHSYTGNPLACAAALATLDIFEQDNVIKANREKADHIEQVTAPLREHPHVGDVRQTGMVVAIEMVRDRATLEPYDFRERRGVRVFRHAMSRGAMLRPLGNVIYWMPPYVIEPGEIDFLAEVTREGLEIATRD
ncbi:adenosylmethionine--8-amino-7-oxononanoate transaminase [Kushneria phosphatilytica]|uniref:Adenosylmethionine-8-amino-7-oxononanoate aminotransferase n=1 Tax=Kushneria phosphatilytica TaxID=657387 RepID=A0A1S1NSC3_9GAMM|nr:adenosylmethionine--8-amino-7-oxononanoate transaminase [Kushneria phosphatilytica]OHV07820.1 adenosylmethionine--8-amino-7-oxononanoate transaminase [Kushneria phosphatilytica]QEL10011.1 adenosylmethionine--8-amino-7-oxononanoate transaminase [Kushneria phosphatilytica]